MTFEGIVKKISTKTGRGKRGSWTLYSFVLGLDNGSESGWITFGFDKEPPFEEGDRVSVGAEEDNNGYLKYVEKSGRIIAATKPTGGGAVASGNAASAQTASSAPVNNGPETALSPNKREVAEAARQNQIVNQHSQEMAIAIVGLLLQHDGLPMTTAATKASQAKRFEEITAAVDKFTIKFHNDVVTGRLATTVADMGVVEVGAKDAIPAAGKAPADKSNTSGDDY